MSASNRVTAWAANLLLAGAALLFSFGLLELGVRLFVDVKEFAPIGIHEVDPELPIRFLPHRERSYETHEFSYTVRFNRFGRRDDEWTPETVADPDNLLFIGDSFVLGNGVEHESAIPTRLERSLALRGQPREVFNFGMPAGGPNTYLLLLEHALDSGFAAQTVLVGIFVGNDFYPSILDDRPIHARTEKRAAPQRGPRSQLLRFLKLRLATSPRVTGWALTAGRLLGIDVYDTAGSYIFLREQTPDQSRLFERILDYLARMRDLAESRGREIGFVVFPNRIQVENREDLTSSAFDAARPNDRILAFCGEQGLRCLDLLPPIAAQYENGGEPLYFPIDRHLNDRGTEVAAELIENFLLESGLLR